MQQYFINQTIETNTVEFSSEQQHHMRKVLRMKNGDIVKVVDQQKQPFLVKIEVDENVIGTVVETLEPILEPIKVTLIQGMIKGERWDLLIQKACEFGVDKIIPMISSRTVVKVNDKIDKKLDRYNKIALEACEQSKRNHLVEVTKPIRFQEIDQYKSELNIIAYEDANVTSHALKQLLQQYPSCKTITIVIGSEGGFSSDEITDAMNQGYQCVSLGNRIFRAESAAWAMLQSLMFFYE